MRRTHSKERRRAECPEPYAAIWHHTHNNETGGKFKVLSPGAPPLHRPRSGLARRVACARARHRGIGLKRHCAQKSNGLWYRTIDRITPSLAQQPKLLIPDIKGEANIVLDESGLYPHHNLYYITSRDWPLLALQRVLMSGIARLFVRAYSTKMRGGCLRFQAQYLRRIRIPKWADIPPNVQQILSQQNSEVAPIDIQQVIAMAYCLTDQELNFLTK